MNEEQINQLLLRIVTATINWNGQHFEFDKHFLELQDNFELIFSEDKNTIKVQTNIRPNWTPNTPKKTSE